MTLRAPTRLSTALQSGKTKAEGRRALANLPQSTILQHDARRVCSAVGSMAGGRVKRTGHAHDIFFFCSDSPPHDPTPSPHGQDARAQAAGSLRPEEAAAPHRGPAGAGGAPANQARSQSLPRSSLLAASRSIAVSRSPEGDRKFSSATGSTRIARSLRRPFEFAMRLRLTLSTTASMTLGLKNFLLRPLSSRAQVMAAPRSLSRSSA
jgi:hypothetical protein